MITTKTKGKIFTTQSQLPNFVHLQNKQKKFVCSLKLLLVKKSFQCEMRNDDEEDDVVVIYFVS